MIMAGMGLSITRPMNPPPAGGGSALSVTRRSAIRCHAGKYNGSGARSADDCVRRGAGREREDYGIHKIF
jgi:hypothetical protein